MKGFFSLAERIIEDKRSLEVIFRQRPHGQLEMRSIIKIVEKERFSRVWRDESTSCRPVRYILSEKGTAMLQRRSPSDNMNDWSWAGVPRGGGVFFSSILLSKGSLCK